MEKNFIDALVCKISIFTNDFLKPESSSPEFEVLEKLDLLQSTEELSERDAFEK